MVPAVAARCATRLIGRLVAVRPRVGSWTLPRSTTTTATRCLSLLGQSSRASGGHAAFHRRFTPSRA